MAKQSHLVAQFNAAVRNAYNEGYYYGHAEVRAICLDTVLIALGEIGLTKQQIHDFALKYNEIESQYADLITSDGESTTDGRGKPIHDISYSKSKIDDEIKKYVFEEDFVPFEMRHEIYSKT